MNEIVLAWYDQYKRDLPWRNQKDAYRIWVSEIMLQQTRVEAVKPYYERFIQTLPTLHDLAICEEDKLIKLWEGLGYYSRVRNMQKAAKLCAEKYDAKLPMTYEELITLPGIGPYSASAISSIAYGEKRIALDGNVMRIFARILNLQEDIMSKTTQAKIYAYFEKYSCERMGDLNQALMDFGNAICLPKQALRCNICPLQEYCEGYKAHTAKDLPYKKAKKQRRKQKYTVVMYVCDGKIKLHKRKDTGLLASLYEFTTIEGHKVKKDFAKAIYAGKYTHVFSHVEWDMKGFIIPVRQMDEDGIWVPIEDLIHVYPIPTAFKYYKEKLLEIEN